MNKIKQLSIEYLRASRTIETVAVTSCDKTKVCFVYNFEGNNFRLFDSLISVIQFFELNKEPELSFCNEDDLDRYLIEDLKVY